MPLVLVGGDENWRDPSDQKRHYSAVRILHFFIFTICYNIILYSSDNEFERNILDTNSVPIDDDDDDNNNN